MYLRTRTHVLKSVAYPLILIVVEINIVNVTRTKSEAPEQDGNQCPQHQNRGKCTLMLTTSFTLNFGLFRLDLNPMTDVFIRKPHENIGSQRHTGRTLCDNGSKHWRDVAASQGMVRIDQFINYNYLSSKLRKQNS